MVKFKTPTWALPATTRSRVVLEIASELAQVPDQPYRQAKVMMRVQGEPAWPLCLFGSSAADGIEEVIRREADLAIVNPAGPLTLAYRGTGPYTRPHPVRTVAVIPSFDQYVFAVKKETGLTSFEEIGRRKVPLRIGLRGEPDHCLHSMLEHIAEAAGFSLGDIKTWGGQLRKEGPLPFPDGVKFQWLRRGEIDAIFDEAVQEWIDDAIDAGMTILPLSEATVRKLEAMGYRRGVIEKRIYPKLKSDILSIDFSGWPIFTHAETPDLLVRQICAGLDARKHMIPWQGEGPLPVERMCRDSPDTPIDVPLHPAAERFWRERGYLT